MQTRSRQSARRAGRDARPAYRRNGLTLIEPFGKLRAELPVVRKGFTLIELLVVISIIALLIGILLPALGAARKLSQQLACASNQRQIGTAIFIYEQDYGSLPGPARRAVNIPWSVIPPGQNAANLTYLLRDYLETGWAIDNINTITNPALAREGSLPGYWQCSANEPARELPGFDKRQYLFLINNQNDSDPNYFFGAQQGTAGADPDPNHVDHKPKKVDEIKSAREGTLPADEEEERGASSVWMMSDIDEDNYSFGSDLVGIEAPHDEGEGRNYVYFDGHASMLRRDAWPANASNSDF